MLNLEFIQEDAVTGEAHRMSAVSAQQDVLL